MTEPKKKNPRGRLKGGTALTNVAIKAIRAQDVIKLRAQGVPVPEIAAKYRTTDRSIYRLIKWAETEGLMGELKQRVVAELGSLTIDAYKGALTAPLNSLPTELEAHKVRLTAAKDVGFGTGILTKKTETHETKEEFSMNWFLEQRYGKQADDEEVVEGSDSVLDGDILGDEEGTQALIEGIGETGFQEELEDGDE
jgi:hypothetical protein